MTIRRSVTTTALMGVGMNLCKQASQQPDTEACYLVMMRKNVGIFTEIQHSRALLHTLKRNIANNDPSNRIPLHIGIGRWINSALRAT